MFLDKKAQCTLFPPLYTYFFPPQKYYYNLPTTSILYYSISLRAAISRRMMMFPTTRKKRRTIFVQRRKVRLKSLCIQKRKILLYIFKNIFFTNTLSNNGCRSSFSLERSMLYFFHSDRYYYFPLYYTHIISVIYISFEKLAMGGLIIQKLICFFENDIFCKVRL